MSASVIDRFFAYAGMVAMRAACVVEMLQQKQAGLPATVKTFPPPRAVPDLMEAFRKSTQNARQLGGADKAIKLIERVAKCFVDRRDPSLIEHSATLVGQRIFGLAYLNDHDALRHDPLFAVLASELKAVPHCKLSCWQIRLKSAVGPKQSFRTLCRKGRQLRPSPWGGVRNEAHTAKKGGRLEPLRDVTSL
jgi:hypothetical protein